MEEMETYRLEQDRIWERGGRAVPAQLLLAFIAMG